MRTPASVARHPIHPMLIVFPVGLWVAALVFDIAAAISNGAGPWADLAFYNILGGIVGALAAAVPGFIDYSTLAGRRRRLATWHMALNLGVVTLFLVNLFLRTGWGARLIGPDAALLLVLTIAGNVALVVSGWLGGELVYRLAVGVEEAPDLPRDDVRRAA